MLNDNVRGVNESKTKPCNDTSPNEPPSERVVDFSEIIRMVRTLSAEKKDEYIRLYIEMYWKNPSSHVTLDQHKDVFKQIGMPIQPQHAPSNFRQDKELCTDDNSATKVDEQKEFEFKVPTVPTEDVEQKTKEFEFKAPLTNQLKQRRENIVCPVDDSIGCHIKAQDVEEKENLTNSRTSSRRCTTYFQKRPPHKEN